MALIRKKGGETYVNAEKANAQTSPAIAALTGGGHVVAWADESHVGGDSSGFAIKLQLYDAAGAKTGGELLVNSFTGDNQTQPSVAGLASGGFVVTWTQNEPDAALGGDGSAASIKGQVYSSAGVKVGGEFLVNSGTSWIQDESAVFALPGGGFVVSWWDHGTFNVFARMFDSAGAALGGDILVSNDRQGNQSLPAGTAFGDGRFVIMWSHQDFGPTYDQGVYGQLFNSDGTKSGGEFSVSSVTDNIQDHVEVIRLADGGFVAVWESLVGEDYAIRAQVFDSAGAKSGAELAVSLAGHHGELPTVAALAQGGFFVAWADLRLGTWTERGQQFNAAGDKVGPDFQINSVASPYNAFPKLATLASGEVEAVWSNENGGNSEQLGVKAQSLLMAIAGTAGADTIAGTGGDDAIAGLGGDDAIDGGAGADTMVGGTGNDLYVVDNVGDVVEENAGEGTDEVRTGLVVYSLVALANVENLSAASNVNHDFRGNALDNVITGGGGNDFIRAYDGGDDTILAGAGQDNIFMGGSLNGVDIVNGGADADTLILQGNYAGGLTLSANITQIENISILGGGNTNFGDPGTNLYDYVITTNDANFAAGLQVRVNGAALLAGEDFTFDGSAETDAKFVVYGGRGVDKLTGGLGNDIFFFAEDRFATGDVVNGGPGYDGMFLRGNYTIDFNAPGYTGLFTSIENLTLTSATDERYARGGGTEFDYNITLSDAIVKAGETLTVSGTILMASETMILDASQESDGLLRLFGGKADDTLKGGGQADLIHGNLGADILAGNGGADTFRYDYITESNSATLDHILDFTAGIDKLDLTRIDADSLTAGDQAFSWIGSNAFSHTAGELRAFQSGGDWFVEGDVNGDGVGDLVIQLTLQGPTPLGAGDFLL